MGNPPREAAFWRREIPVAQETKMSRAEAGRKGGLTTKRRYGDEFFGRIGRIGGKKGGDTTKRRYGVEFYQQIGRKGGSK
jgi:general stress protein YciG